jgi:hypothetical protein
MGTKGGGVGCQGTADSFQFLVFMLYLPLWGIPCTVNKLSKWKLNDHRLKAVGFIAAESRVEAKAS